MPDPSTKARLNKAEKHLLIQSASRLECLGRYRLAVDNPRELFSAAKDTPEGRLASGLREMVSE